MTKSHNLHGDKVEAVTMLTICLSSQKSLEKQPLLRFSLDITLKLSKANNLGCVVMDKIGGDFVAITAKGLNMEGQRMEIPA